MMLLQAVPVPPTPPDIPFDPNLVGGHVSSAAQVLIAFAVMAAFTIVLWPIARALARRLEGKGDLSPALQGELEQLHHRLADLDVLQARVAELEERLDFTERMLAQTREPDRLER
jgi:Tfp pilus assembly protein PilO